MTTVLIAMAGLGSRFTESGYALSKPVIPTTDRRTGRKVPMVVAAALDLPEIRDPGTRMVLVGRDHHVAAGVDAAIRAHFPSAEFMAIDYTTEGQASTCLVARDRIDPAAPLVIGACDNGMAWDAAAFARARDGADALIFTYRNHDHVLAKPEAYGWVRVGPDGATVTGMSVKVPISDRPMDDHAVVASFWFRRGVDFLRAADRMVAADDRINGEFYVDQAMQHAVDLGMKVRVFEVERYLCWGTPREYEAWERTIGYWSAFQQGEEWLRP